MKVNSAIRYYLTGSDKWGDPNALLPLENIWQEKINSVFVCRKGNEKRLQKALGIPTIEELAIEANTIE
jgi:hypothetical protein